MDTTDAEKDKQETKRGEDFPGLSELSRQTIQGWTAPRGLLLRLYLVAPRASAGDQRTPAGTAREGGGCAKEASSANNRTCGGPDRSEVERGSASPAFQVKRRCGWDRPRSPKKPWSRFKS